MNEGSSKKKPALCRRFVLCLVLGSQLSLATLVAQWNAAGWTAHDLVVVGVAIFSGVAWLMFLREEDQRSNGAG